MEYGYDGNYGRPKAIRYPSAVNLAGETVKLEYDAQGYLLGERTLSADFVPGRQLRRVLGLSERGQVTEQRLGNCVRETGEYDASTGLVLSLSGLRPAPSPATPPDDPAACPGNAVTQAVVRQDEYRYDRFLNLAKQTKNVASTQVEEKFSYDNLQRLTSAERITPCTESCTGPVTTTLDSYAYDVLGNITSKSDYATSYTYGVGTNPVGQRGPHAVVSAVKTTGVTATFSYDANGNMTSGDGRTVSFDARDRPVQVVMGTTTSDFDYAPSGGRYLQKVTRMPGDAFGPKTVYYVDKDYELTVWGPGSTSPYELEERTFIGGSVAVLTTQTAAGVKDREVRYQHVDRLGSVEAATVEKLEVVIAATDTTPAIWGPKILESELHGFDAWGRPRSGTWQPSEDRLHKDGEPETLSTRGFTGHEHLDATYLIHMNGRVYDYRLGRFLSVDPIISNPLSSQAINPYSYIGNNPLSGTDPTGYQSRSICEGTGGASNCSMNGVDSQVVRNAMNDAAAKNVGGGTSGGSTNSGAVGARPTQHGAEPVNSGGTTEVNRQQPAGGGAGGQEGRALQLDRDFRYIPAAPDSGFAWEPVLKNPGAPPEGSGPTWYPGANMRNGGLGVLAGIGEATAGRLTLGSNWKTYASGWRGNQYVSTLKLSTAFQIFGIVSLGLGTAIDAVGVANYYEQGPDSPNAVHPAHAGINLGVGIYGAAGGAMTLPITVPYFLIDNLYPGGWPQALDDRARLQAETRRFVPNFNIDREGGARY
jgi:RHS repeat-associated protein